MNRGELDLAHRLGEDLLRLSGQRIRDKGPQHLPGEEAWLIGEHRMSGEKKYYLANLPAKTDLRTLAATIKARWICEQAHQQMKEELGLDHFEGRSWQGLHRHALMTMIAYASLADAEPQALLNLLHSWRSEAGRAGRAIKRIVVAYEAGRDGFCGGGARYPIYQADTTTYLGRISHRLDRTSFAWRTYSIGRAPLPHLRVARSRTRR
jgi:hypothetical protein